MHFHPHALIIYVLFLLVRLGGCRGWVALAATCALLSLAVLFLCREI